MTRAELDAALHDAHNAGDKARISALYAQAAQTEPAEDARAFFLTQAYVFALEIGSPEAAHLREALVALGAER